MTKRKKRAKRGRPRIEGCIREPNGRISRANPYHIKKHNKVNMLCAIILYEST
ncbi:hypothetical protein MNL07_01130 [Bartonella krasnovii]|uniref:hypothetical protein n=1 Tax=Bartonella krasnovii TaxID=2267275 RepID=UPI001F4CFA87|nr:hypothetical protein [Bartonella krasnovii]UNF44797.1 hypothetical protein MNL07_01130 [Bartonella krasnovii]